MKQLAAVALVAALILAGGVAYSFLKPPAAPSGAISAVPLATPSPAADEPAATASPATAAGATAPASGDAAVFEIEQEGSEARFVIDEVLNGSPKAVVGATDQVAGQLELDPEDAGAARVGVIRINARTFATDDGRRDRAIQNRVLETAEYEYVTFAPKRLEGAPERVGVGQTVSFRMVGDLTIRDVTREATFQVRATLAAADRLEGEATTMIRHADWELSIPQVPFVASVSEELRLELEWVARAS